MLYPELTLKIYWDLFITLILLFACLVTPYRIAFVKRDDQVWNIIDAVVDILFVIDIILIFNTAFYDSNYKLIDNRS